MTEPADKPLVLTERDGGIATLTLNRPEVRNALDQALIDALHDALDELEPDPSIGVLVVRGAGEKAFVSGADIGQLRERRSPEAFRRINQGLFRRLEGFPAPTIASVRGWALGGGCELAMACDLRVASETAKFGQPEVGLGIIPGAGGTHRLAKLVGLGKARELIFTGEIIDADAALRIGLVNRVVPDAELQTATGELAGKIAKNSAGAVRLAKLALNVADETGGHGRDAVEVLAQAICFDSEDKVARMTKFLERKKSK